MKRGIFETENSKLEQTGATKEIWNNIVQQSQINMNTQDLTSDATSERSSARRSQALDLDSIMVGIEEYLNNDDSDHEQKTEATDVPVNIVDHNLQEKGTNVIDLTNADGDEDSTKPLKEETVPTTQESFTGPKDHFTKSSAPSTLSGETPVSTRDHVEEHANYEHPQETDTNDNSGANKENNNNVRQEGSPVDAGRSENPTEASDKNLGNHNIPEKQDKLHASKSPESRVEHAVDESSESPESIETKNAIREEHAELSEIDESSSEKSTNLTMAQSDASTQEKPANHEALNEDKRTPSEPLHEGTKQDPIVPATAGLQQVPSNEVNKPSKQDGENPHSTGNNQSPVRSLDHQQPLSNNQDSSPCTAPIVIENPQNSDKSTDSHEQCPKDKMSEQTGSDTELQPKERKEHRASVSAEPTGNGTVEETSEGTRQENVERTAIVGDKEATPTEERNLTNQEVREEAHTPKGSAPNAPTDNDKKPVVSTSEHQEPEQPSSLHHSTPGSSPPTKQEIHPTPEPNSDEPNAIRSAQNNCLPAENVMAVFTAKSDYAIEETKENAPLSPHSNRGRPLSSSPPSNKPEDGPKLPISESSGKRLEQNSESDLRASPTSHQVSPKTAEHPNPETLPQSGAFHAQNLPQPPRNSQNNFLDAETEAILRGLENPEELLKDLESERRNEPVYIFTSLAGGGFHMIPRTNRLATILQANRINFSYKDLGTDPHARNLWKAHASGKQPPGLVRGSDVVGNWQDVDDANEDYRLHDLLYRM